MNRLLTAAEFQQHFQDTWAMVAWDAQNFCYDLFIDQQMNEGIDEHEGTRFRDEVTA